MKYDLELFAALNEEYRNKRLVRKPPTYSAAVLKQRGRSRVKGLAARFGIAGKRLLEIGCGRGETCYAFATQHGCSVVGVDITEYPQWKAHQSPTLSLVRQDLSQEPVALAPSQFDFAYSNAVWEHVRHPFAMLKAVHALLKPGGTFYIVANLHRGPKASHRYREVFFPWPHLLFTDEVFERYYASIGKAPARAAWVNRLSIADYFLYFDLVGFERAEITYSTTPIDEQFYQRFSDILERYPRYDLERDFLHAVLIKR